MAEGNGRVTNGELMREMTRVYRSVERLGADVKEWRDKTDIRLHDLEIAQALTDQKADTIEDDVNSLGRKFQKWNAGNSTAAVLLTAVLAYLGINNQ